MIEQRSVDDAAAADMASPSRSFWEGYDYRDFWKGRDYEWWSEARVLRRLIAQLGRPQWLVDFGGGYGRNLIHYGNRVTHAVIADTSLTNLEHAAQLYRRDIDDGRLFLVRTQLERLPFVDAAFDAAIVVRVLHHLSHIDVSLGSMSRAVGRHWIIDVPIKHHLLAQIRSIGRHERERLSDRQPLVTGTTAYPFYNFHLGAVRDELTELGWQSDIAASVNNLRRWDRRLPRPVVSLLKPLAYGIEAAAQRMGRGWWGPSQFLFATRRPAKIPGLSAPPAALAGVVDAELARRMVCPACRTGLEWKEDTARCTSCDRAFDKRASVWDFVVP